MTEQKITKSKQDVSKTLVKIIKENSLKEIPHEINEQTGFYFDLCLDSLDMAYIVCGIEREFDLRFDDIKADKIIYNTPTFGQLLDFVYDELNNPMDKIVKKTPKQRIRNISNDILTKAILSKKSENSI